MRDKPGSSFFKNKMVARCTGCDVIFDLEGENLPTSSPCNCPDDTVVVVMLEKVENE